MSKKRQHIIPALVDWNMYAENVAGKHSYDKHTSGGRQYSISPIASDRGRHLGYALSVFPGGRDKHRGHTAILSTGDEGGDFDLNRPQYRSPQAAVAAARKHATRYGIT